MPTTITRGTRSGYSCKDFTRISPTRGIGFILTRLAMFPDSTRTEVYRDSPYYSKYFGPGYHSAIWAWALENHLIASNGGDEWVKSCPFFCCHEQLSKRAMGKFENGKYTVRYRLTDYGRSILNKMTDRRGMPRFTEVNRPTPPPVRVPETKPIQDMTFSVLHEAYAKAAMEADRANANAEFSAEERASAKADQIAKEINRREKIRFSPEELRNKIDNAIRELQELRDLI